MDMAYITSKQWNQITVGASDNTTVSLVFSHNGKSVTVDFANDEGRAPQKKLKTSFTSEEINIYNFQNGDVKLYLRKKNQPFKGKEAQYCDHYSSEMKISNNNYLVSLDGYCFVEGN